MTAAGKTAVFFVLKSCDKILKQLREVEPSSAPVLIRP